MKREINPVFLEAARKRVQKEMEQRMEELEKMGGPVMPEFPDMDTLSENDGAMIEIRRKYRRLLGIW